MKKEIITSPAAPAAIGPYSVAVRAGNLVFTSGQLGLDPLNGSLVPGGIAAETGRALANLRSVLQAAGCDLEDIVKTTVYLADMADFNIMNTVYTGFFPHDPPARTTIQAAALPKGARVEIDAVATL